MILWDLGGQEDLQQLWDKVCVISSIDSQCLAS